MPEVDRRYESLVGSVRGLLSRPPNHCLFLWLLLLLLLGAAVAVRRNQHSSDNIRAECAAV